MSIRHFVNLLMMRNLVFTLILLTVLVVAAFAKTSALSVEDVFNKVAQIERFEMLPVNDGVFGFPENIGNGTMAVHPNASPREEIIGLLNKLPKETLVYDETDERGRFDRIYFENGTTLLYVHVSISTGDTVLIIFRDCNESVVVSFIEELNEQQRQ